MLRNADLFSITINNSYLVIFIMYSYVTFLGIQAQEIKIIFKNIFANTITQKYHNQLSSELKCSLLKSYNYSCSTFTSVPNA